MGSVTPIDVPNTAAWATLLAKTVCACNYRGGWQGIGVDCNMRISAAANATQDLNAGTFIQGTMEWVVGGGSTLKFQEWAKANAAGVGVSPDRDIDAAGGNIKIQGLAVCTTANDAANKSYVDSKVNDMLDLHDPIDTVSDGVVTTGAYDSGAGTLIITNVTSTTQFTNPQAAAVDCGSVTLAFADRILFRSAIGGAVSAADGVYTYTAMAGNQATFTRATDLDPPLDKGAFVLVDGAGADAEGQGYVLNADAATVTDAQPWILFSSQQIISFEAPIVNIGGNWTVGGLIDGSEQFLPLVAGNGAANGKAAFGSTVGKSAAAFAIHGQNITLNDAGILNINATASATIVAPTTVITANAVLTLDATGGDTKIYGNANIFAKASGGGNPNANLPTYTEVKAMGAVAPTTSAYAIASIETVGNGVLFDTVSNFAGTNQNEGVFYWAPHYNGSNNGDKGCVSFDLMTFATTASGVGSVIAQIIPPP